MQACADLPTSPTAPPAAPGVGRGWAVCEGLAILVLFALFAGQTPPAVNEAHYLAKARHFWDPTWCARDLFVSSRDAHGVYCALVGWLTCLFSFPIAAWCARVFAWGSLAYAWQRLSSTLVPRRGAALLSAALWIGLLDQAAMAGEWVVGGSEAKCLAYALVLIALEQLTRNRWTSALALLGTATSCHVLVGGWSLVAAGVAWLACGSFRPPLLRLLPGALLALLLALPGLVPALRLTSGIDPQIVAEAEWIYVYGRLSHHLVFHRLEPTAVAAHVALLIGWLGLAWATPCTLQPQQLGQRPLRGFVVGAVLLAMIGVALDQLLLGQWELSARLLRYYWFRLSDALLPAGAALALVGAMVRWWHDRPRLARGLLVGSLLAALLTVLPGVARQGVLAPRDVDPQWRTLIRWQQLTLEELPQHAHDWQDVCGWIRRETPREALFITPRQQQTFRWWAERAEVVNVKDIPQDAPSVVEWQYRREWLYPPDTGTRGLAAHGAAGLVELARRYGADYIVVDEFLGKTLLALPIAYPPPHQRSAYRVYLVPQGSPEGAAPHDPR